MAVWTPTTVFPSISTTQAENRKYRGKPTEVLALLLKLLNALGKLTLGHLDVTLLLTVGVDKDKEVLIDVGLTQS